MDVLHVDKNKKHSLETAKVGVAEPSVWRKGGYLLQLQDVLEVRDAKMVNTRERKHKQRSLDVSW